MAALNFEKQINLTEYMGNPNPTLVQSLMIGNEPKNDIWQYYMYNEYAFDKGAQIDYGNYDTLEWQKATRHLSNQKVRRMGIKHFPQVGAIGFFTLLNEERSKILAPVHVKSTKYTTPIFTMEETDTTFIFHCSSPKEVTYACYRIILRLDKFAHEYITYEETLEASKPATTGTYDIYCVGYIHEGEAVSEDSIHYSVDITGTQEDWPGPMEGSDLFITDVEITPENKVNIRRSDGFTKDSDNSIPVPISATFLSNNRLQITFNNGTTIISDNAPSGGGGSAMDYTPLKYISNNRSRPYINTRVVPTPNTRVLMRVINTAKASYFFGCWAVNYNNGAYALCNDSSGIYIGYDGQGGGLGGSVVPQDSNEHTVELNKNKAYVDGELRYTFNEVSSLGNTDKPLFLFSQNRAGTPAWRTTSYNSDELFSLVSCQIWEGDTLIRDFRPCIAIFGVPCLFDEVNSRYYIPESGSFTEGPLL